jgi:hypothetical protein
MCRDSFTVAKIEGTLAVMVENRFPTLIPFYQNQSNGESHKADAIFREFLSGNFCYDAISNHPDYMSYASAETLVAILPLIIDEMFRRGDTGNYLVYPLISAIDPDERTIPEYTERTQKFIALADKALTEKICKFLAEMEIDNPVTDERLAAISAFWRNRQKTGTNK